MKSKSATKAFIFDLDGVLINNEPRWEDAKKKMYPDVFGPEISAKLGLTVGSNIDSIFEESFNLGSSITLQRLYDEFNKYALPIYAQTPIADGIQELGNELINSGFKIGIVSASPKEWMNLVIERLMFKEKISVIISLDERGDLKHKPAPDGYLEAIRILGSTPSATYILEDSNTGIASAKTAGATVIGLKQNLLPGYIQQGADIYVDRVEDVMEILTVEKNNKMH